MKKMTEMRAQVVFYPYCNIVSQYCRYNSVWYFYIYMKTTFRGSSDYFFRSD